MFLSLIFIGPKDTLKDKPIKELFDGFEIQENIDNAEHWRKNMIRELNELHTAGLSTPEHYAQDLKKTSRCLYDHFILNLVKIIHSYLTKFFV